MSVGCAVFLHIFLSLSCEKTAKSNPWERLSSPLIVSAAPLDVFMAVGALTGWPGRSFLGVHMAPATDSAISFPALLSVVDGQAPGSLCLLAVEVCALWSSP